MRLSSAMGEMPLLSNYRDIVMQEESSEERCLSVRKRRERDRERSARKSINFNVAT